MKKLLTKFGTTSKHYKGQDIEPIDVINSWNLDFFEGNVIKYLFRQKFAEQQLSDREKLVNYAKWILERHESSS